MFSTRLWLLTWFCFSPLATSQTSIDCSGGWFPGRTQKSISHHQRWLYEASLVQFEDARWCSAGGISDHHLTVWGPIFHFCISNSSKCSTFSCRADFQSFEYSTNDHNTPPALTTWRWPQSCLLKASSSLSHLSPPRIHLWTACATQKHVCMTLCELHTFAEAFQVYCGGVSPTGTKISGLFVARCISFLL